MKGKIKSKVLFETEEAYFGTRIKTCTDDKGISYSKKEPFIRLKKEVL